MTDPLLSPPEEHQTETEPPVPLKHNPLIYLLLGTAFGWLLGRVG